MVQFEVPDGNLDVDLDYTRYTNRQLLLVPLAVLAVALLIIAGWYVATGVPVALGIDFTGGTELRVSTTDSPEQIRQTFAERVPYEVDSVARSGDSYIVTFQATEQSQVQEITDAARNAGYNVLSAQTRSPTFGASAQQQALIAVAVAFVGMSIVVFLLFRTFVPSLAVVAAAFSDIVIPIALMNVFGIKLSLGTVAALLMIIGYSVDSDILLTNNVLRRKGGFYESTYRARRTGVTMTVTSIVAVAVMAFCASNFVFGIPLLPQMGIVLVFGLIADLMNTYLLNVSILRYYKYEGVAK
jgi:preprotein translocase subunit SecF